MSNEPPVHSLQHAEGTNRAGTPPRVYPEQKETALWFAFKVSRDQQFSLFFCWLLPLGAPRPNLSIPFRPTYAAVSTASPSRCSKLRGSRPRLLRSCNTASSFTHTATDLRASPPIPVLLSARRPGCAIPLAPFPSNSPRQPSSCCKSKASSHSTTLSASTFPA